MSPDTLTFGGQSITKEKYEAGEFPDSRIFYRGLLTIQQRTQAMVALFHEVLNAKEMKEVMGDNRQKSTRRMLDKMTSKDFLIPKNPASRERIRQSLERKLQSAIEDADDFSRLSEGTLLTVVSAQLEELNDQGRRDFLSHERIRRFLGRIAGYDVLYSAMHAPILNILTDTRRRAWIVHEVRGNPFRPVTFDPSWRTRPALGVASAMYNGNNFADMPVLADALDEAGCESQEVLAHCRGPGPHVRGCWVVDGVLGKE